MFAKNKVSQSLVDAVSSIINEAEKVPTSEGWDEMLKSVKDKNKPQPSGGAGKKQGSRYGGSKQKEEPEEKEVKEEKSDEPFKPKKYTGTSKQLMQPEFKLGPKPQPKNEELKGNQHKIDKNKNNKIDAEDFKMLRKEELKGNQHKIDANKNNKIDAHDFQLLRGKKKVKEDTFVGKLFNSLSESEEIRRAINEVMKRDASAGDWISDFLHSDNPKFDGKSKAERKKMALAAYYSMKKRSRNESVEDLEMNKVADEAEDTAARKSIKAKDTEKSQKINNLDVKYGKPNAFGEEVELTEDYDSKLNGIANKHGFKKKDSLIGVHLEHPKHGRISLTHAGAWTHDKPIHSGEGQYKGSGMATHKTIHSGHGLNNLDKHLSSLSEEVELDEGRGVPVPVGAPSPATIAARAAIAAHLDSKKSDEDRHLANWKKSEHAPNDNDRATDENPQSGGDLHAIHQAAVKYMKTVKEPNPTTHSRFGSGTRFGEIAMAIANRFHQERVTKKTRLNNSFELNGFELNEVSKSEVDHHYDKWTTSSDAPNHHDAGDDDKIHKSALKYLRGTNVPKENHEKIAMHIANKFHGSGIDEAAPKKMDDVAKQNLTPAKKGVVGTVKSDFKNFKSFLAGKPETNEAVDSNNQTIDTLAGRSKKVPKEAKIDNAHSSAKVALKAEEVESLDEDAYLNKFLSSRGINPKFVSRNTKVAHAKSNEYKTWLKNHRDIDGYKMSEASEVPFDGPYTSTKKNVKDKSGAVHTPMSRAKDLAQQAMQRVKKDLK